MEKEKKNMGIYGVEEKFPGKLKLVVVVMAMIVAGDGIAAVGDDSI